MWCAWSPGTSAASCWGRAAWSGPIPRVPRTPWTRRGSRWSAGGWRFCCLCSYAQYERVKLETEGFGGVIAEADYGADIALTVLLPEERSEDYLAHMLDITAGTVEGMVCGERFQDVPWRAPIEKEE